MPFGDSNPYSNILSNPATTGTVVVVDTPEYPPPTNPQIVAKPAPVFGANKYPNNLPYKQLLNVYQQVLQIKPK